ncbi:MAG: hypothetical protein JNM19_08115 [Chitinophagaceae bacterium]|nr:hypothetical protein [Chitinophagaceae bacterium]
MNRITLCLGILLCCLVSYSQTKKHSDIHFSFTAKRINTGITVNATLHNPYADTVYFLSTSCDGLPYSLQLDTAKFTASARFVCNASWPVILKIPPAGKLDFAAYLTSRKKENELKLGFDFYEVGPSFDTNVQGLNVHNREAAHRNVIWANVCRFE